MKNHGADRKADQDQGAEGEEGIFYYFNYQGKAFPLIQKI